MLWAKNEKNYSFLPSFDSFSERRGPRKIRRDLPWFFDPSISDQTHLYNWVYNRVKFIIGEDYQLRGRNLVSLKGHRFTSTPIPPSVLNRTNQYAGTIIMSNVGAELYLLGKLDNILKGIKLDNKSVFAPSPRVGILQVGEGHF